MPAAKIWTLIGFGLPLGLLACGGDGLTLPSEGEAAHIEIIDGNNQSALVNTQLAPIVVAVTDPKGRPVSGATVEFVLAGGAEGGSIAPSTAQTDGDGHAWATITLGTRVGQITGQARLSEDVAADFVATAQSSTANRIELVSGEGQFGAVGTVLPAPLVVRVSDGFGNRIPNVPVQWSAVGGGSVSQENTQTDVNGEASVQRTLGNTAGQQTTLATAPDLAGSPVTFTHTATAGSAARVLVVSGNGQQGAPGAPLPQPLVVQVLDADNNPISGRAVTWVIGAGEGSVTPETSSTDGEGRASTQWTLGPNPGRNTLSAVVSGVGVGAFNATAAKAAAAVAIVSHQPEPSAIGQPVAIGVQVSGSGGTPTGTVTVTGEGASAPCTITLAGGAGACNLTFGVAGNQRIDASYSGDAVFNGGSAHLNHRVEAANGAPTAAFEPPTCTANEPCQFTDASSDPEGELSSWLWDFGDGATSDQRSPAHSFAAPGSYNVKLTVHDSDGASADVTHAVNVSAAPTNNPPVAAADQYQTPAGQTLTVAAPGVLANDTDDTGPLSAQLVSQPAQGIVSLNADGSFQYFPGLALPGSTDSFTYSASDGSLSSTATVTISIQ